MLLNSLQEHQERQLTDLPAGRRGLAQPAPSGPNGAQLIHRRFCFATKLIHQRFCDATKFIAGTPATTDPWTDDEKPKSTARSRIPAILCYDMRHVVFSDLILTASATPYYFGVPPPIKAATSTPTFHLIEKPP